MLRDLSLGHVLLILLLIVLLFGSKRLPELARSLGRSLSEFKKGMREDSTDSESKDKDKEPEKKA